MELKIDKVELNLINGLRNLPIFNIKADNLGVNIDKGSQFLFFKLLAKSF